MIRARNLLIVTPLLMGLAHAPASGRLGVFALIEKVVLEPNDSTPDRIQIWGAFSYVDGGVGAARAVTVARKGYMYFTFPITRASGAAVGTDIQTIARVRKEWADLKAVAATGQAVGFGEWGYFGDFSGIEPLWGVVGNSFRVISTDTTGFVPIPESVVRSGALRFRPVTESVAGPALYSSNAGIVKLGEWSHADVIRKLREALGT